MKKTLIKTSCTILRYMGIILLMVFALTSCRENQITEEKNIIRIQTETSNIENVSTENPQELIVQTVDDNITVVPQEDSLIDGLYTKHHLYINDVIIEFKGYSVQHTEPEIYTQDLNSDGYTDYIILLVSGRGSNIWTEEIHIFDGISKQEYTIFDPFTYIREQVVFSADEEKYTIYLAGEDIFISKKDLKTPANHLFQHIQYGASYSYEVNNNELICQVRCMVGPAETYGYFNIKYVFNENNFIPSSILFVQ